ncbi:MAG: ATPase inhibitor subunit zeta, partial [Rhodospirillales bacterium]
MSNDAFGDRERAEEAKFKQDQELEFKSAARRNRLLGEWLARQFGMISSEVEGYARDIVMVDFDEPG